MLQARYKHLLNIQASLQRKALLGSQDHLGLEEQQYLQAQEQQQQQAQLIGIGAGAETVSGAAGVSGRLLPQADVDTATRNVLAGASAVIKRDQLLSPSRPTF